MWRNLLLLVLFNNLLWAVACSGGAIRSNSNPGQSSGNTNTGTSGANNGAGSTGGASSNGGSGGSGAGSGASMSACNAMATGQGASLNGFVPFSVGQPLEPGHLGCIR